MTVKEEFSVLWQNFGGKLKQIAVILYYLGLIALVYLAFQETLVKQTILQLKLA